MIGCNLLIIEYANFSTAKLLIFLLLFTVMQNMQAPVLQDRLQESEKLIKEMTKTWEEKLAEKDKINQVRVPADGELVLVNSTHWFNLSPNILN